ncbi:MAG TPA: hypothetical protein VF631_12225 [Allosphingosinicella sp.]|jgi:protein involved in polysaccharide export with SLBB domain|uniref:hypothetical protein n=1 Tax=Allosphingosinicella sp. TaxID=2823234 RepID=UPI002F28F1D7
MARYVIRAINQSGPVSFQDPLTLDAALRKAAELRDAHFQHITLVNTMTGLEITDLEDLIRGLDSPSPPSH